jgi:hypothetical protein
MENRRDNVGAALITASGLGALLLTPFALIYPLIKLKSDILEQRWGMVVLGVFSALLPLIAMVYFAILFHSMGVRGLGI